MELRRLRAGEWIAAVSGAALIGSLFLPWYSADVACPLTAGADCPNETVAAWEAFTFLDVVLFSAGAMGTALLVVTATQRTVAVPIAMSALTTWVGLVASALALYRLIDLPPLVDGSEPGVWVGLVAAAGLAAGGWLAMRDERLSGTGAATDATGRHAPRTEVERLPAPPAETSR